MARKGGKRTFAAVAPKLENSFKADIAGLIATQIAIRLFLVDACNFI